MKKKHIALLMACVMLMGVAIGGTFAWLTDKTPEVKNTFTTSDINITLDESERKADGTLDTEKRVISNNNYQMIPGWDIAKDPKVTVKAGSEDCYVFVKIDKANNYDSYMNGYAVDPAWTQLTVTDAETGKTSAVAGVFYQEVRGLTADWFDYVLASKEGATTADEGANGYVTVLGTVTKEMMEAIDGVDANGATDSDAAKAEIAARPTLILTAYASQLMKDNDTPFDPYEAWTNVYSASTN